MFERPYFSIIVVSLNSETTIKETIDSILNQNFANYEIIIKDGCSKDGTIIQIPKSDKIKIIIKPDNGVYDAMNEAIKLSSGCYICFMNCGDKFSDSTVLQTIFETSIKINGNRNIIYSDYKRNDVISKMPKNLYDFYLYRTPLNHQTLYISKELFEEYGYYDVSYKILADYEHTLRTYRNAIRFIYCDCVSCDYLGGGLSESKNGVILKKYEYKRIRKKYFNKLQLLKYSFIIFLSFKKIREAISSDKSPKFIRMTYRRVVNKLNRL